VKVDKLLRYLGFEVKKEGTQLCIKCVSCDDQKKHLYISMEKGVGYCFRCGFKTNLWGLIKHFYKDWSPAQISDLLKQYGVPVSFSVRDTPRPKIKKKQYRSIADDELKQLCQTKNLDFESVKLFNPYIQTDEPIALIPAYYPEDDRSCSILRCSLDGKQIETKHGPQKYPMWYGSTHGLYGVPWIEKENPEQIVFCEAWRDALAVISQGYFATASTGGASTFQAAWLPLFVDRDVLICMDADAAGAKHAQTSYEYISRVAKSVKIIHLPYKVEKSHGKDLHDYLVTEGNLFDELVRDQDQIKVEVPPKQILLPDKQPYTLAKAFLDHTGKICKHHRSLWLEYNDGGYRITDETEMVKDLWRFISIAKYDTGKEFQPVTATESVLKNIMGALSSLPNVWIKNTIELPVWISGGTGLDTENLIVVKNGILDISDEKPVLMPHTSNYVSTTSIPVAHDPKAECPEWKRFLSEVISETRLCQIEIDEDDGLEEKIVRDEYRLMPNVEEINMLMEFFGLLLVPVTKYQKILGLVGPKRSGKGTITRIMYKLLGRDNCTMPTLGSLASQGGMQSLIGRSAALITDASSGGKMDMPACVERLKQISGEDPVTIDPKHKSPIDLPKLPTRFCLTANSIQQLTDATAALASRFLFAQTGRSFYGEENLDLARKLETELSGILSTRCSPPSRTPVAANAAISSSQNVVHWQKKRPHRSDRRSWPFIRNAATR